MSERIGYVVKVYPRFSETFIVTEILARESQGEEIDIIALRPTSDVRFHAELARVRAEVTHLGKPYKLSDGWLALTEARRELPGFDDRWHQLWPMLARMEAADVVQAVQTARHAHRRGLTHLHAHFASLAGRVAAVAATLAGVGFSLTCHAKDLFHDDVDDELLRDTLGAADTVITISEYNVAHLGERFPEVADRIRLVHNGLELTRFPYRDPAPVDGTLDVLAVGRLVEKKGFDVLIDAAARLDDGICVRIAGAGELHDDLAARIERAGLADRVTLLGARSQSEIVQLLGCADVLVTPSVVGADGNADGLPTVLLEAMATGVPCLASDVTGIGEVVTPTTGILLPPGDADALAEALAAVRHPDFDRVGRARAARALIEQQFDARRQAARLKEHT